LNWVGFAPSVKEEWAAATALLVPVTIKIGFRTRIVEAWCRGVPVIAHPSAEAGLPQMRAGVNYLAAVTAGEWIAAMCALEKDRQKAASLAKKGRETYLREFSVEAGAERFGRLTELAILSFGNIRGKSARCAS
jgi:glycosyltransferase involved in cell wall biosynthesis